MLWLISIAICVIAFIIGFIFMIKGDKFGFCYMKISMGCMVLFSILGVMCSIGIAFTCISPQGYSKTESLHSNFKIENMQDNRDINGKISGNLFYTKGQENTEYYYYFMKWEDDCLIPDKVKASDTKIKDISEGEIPHIEEYVYYEETENSNSETEIFWFTFSGIVDELLKSKTKEPSYKLAYYKLYVPLDDVSSEYHIDLQ